MILTKHGGERIHRRTRMVVKDVLSLIRSGACVELGAAGGLEYLLFYSPPDTNCKVAVVSEGRSHLISVWETYFDFPEGVKRITAKLENDAHLAVRAFLMKRLSLNAKKETPSAPQGPPTEQHLFKVEVQVGRKIEFVHEIGTRPVTRKATLQSVVGALHEDLRTLVLTVEDNRERVGNPPVSYNICEWRRGRFVRQHHVTHKTLLRYIQAAA